MELEHKDQDQTLPTSPMSTKALREGTEKTLKIPENLSPVQIRQLLGSAFFSDHAHLVLYFDNAPEPLVISPPPHTYLGRTEENQPESLYLNLAPYDAREKGVSRTHALLLRSDVTLSIQDLDSKNGTYLEGYKLPSGQTQILRDGCEIVLGILRIRIAFQYGSIE
jgi:hypothetical protein